MDQPMALIRRFELYDEVVGAIEALHAFHNQQEA